MHANGDLRNSASQQTRLVPNSVHRVEIRVVNSRFIATISPAGSVEEARAFIQNIRSEFSDATHNVPAFIIGHGASITEHCQDDGEPSGTAGRPVLAVLKGSGLGDIVAVVTRYYGGTKLGKGGLVRAYGDAVSAALENLPLAAKVATDTLIMAIPYNLFETSRRMVAEHHGEILDETFAEDVTLTLRFESSRTETFIAALFDASHGTVRAEIVQHDPETRFPL